MKKNIEEFISCVCKEHAIKVEFNAEENEMYMSLFSYGITSNMSIPAPWKYRLGYIWRIITKGTPYADSIILNKEDILKFKKIINRIEKESRG